MNTAKPAQPRGIGGWLLLPALGTVLSPIRLAFEIYRSVASLQLNVAPDERALWLFVAAELVVNVGLLVGWVYAVVLLIRHRRSFPVTFNALLLLAFAFTLIDVLVAQFGFNARLTWEEFMPAAANALACVIWVPYMLSSERVRNTFTVPGRRPVTAKGGTAPSPPV
jgi:Protein of unknown function (DUF2569)